MHIKLGTRKSKLAMWQAHYVQDLLEKKGATVEIVDIETKGDKQLKVSIAAIGSKGVFTEELEDMLRSGEVDIAVHSAKDLQSDLGPGFEIIAFSEREKAHDVLVSDSNDISLNDEITVGTSSARRVAILKKHYPNIRTVNVRGNLQTRIQKMRDGLCDALLLAYAGVFRMGYTDMIAQNLSLEEFTPAAGQGAIAIESSDEISEDKKKFVIDAVHNSNSGSRLILERAFLKELEGGCSIPSFCYAEMKDDVLTATGGIIALDGTEQVICQISGHSERAVVLGTDLAKDVLNTGGKSILEEIKRTKNSKLN